MNSVELYVDGIPENSGEWNQLEEIMNICLNGDFSVTEWISVFMNVIIEYDDKNTELDCVILTNRGILILDCKHYKGQIIGTVKDSKNINERKEYYSWKIKTESGIITLNEGRKNIFNQLTDQRKIFCYNLVPIINIRKEEVFKTNANCYLQKGSSWDQRDNIENKAPWFDIISSDDLIKKINQLDGPKLSKSDIEKIINHFGLIKKDPNSYFSKDTFALKSENIQQKYLEKIEIENYENKPGYLFFGPLVADLEYRLNKFKSQELVIDEEIIFYLNNETVNIDQEGTSAYAIIEELLTSGKQILLEINGLMNDLDWDVKIENFLKLFTLIQKYTEKSKIDNKNISIKLIIVSNSLKIEDLINVTNFRNLFNFTFIPPAEISAIKSMISEMISTSYNMNDNKINQLVRENASIKTYQEIVQMTLSVTNSEDEFFERVQIALSKTENHSKSKLNEYAEISYGNPFTNPIKPVYDTIQMNAIGGNNYLKSIFNHLVKIDLPKNSKGVNIMIYGPPGSGKSYIVRKIADALRLMTIEIVGSEIINKYIGDTEKNLADIYKRARSYVNRNSNEGVVLLYDDVDQFFDGNENKVANIVKSTMLANYQSELNKGIITIICTNVPNKYNAQIQSRSNYMIYMGSPTAEDEYYDIIQKMLGELDFNEDLFDLSGNFKSLQDFILELSKISFTRKNSIRGIISILNATVIDGEFLLEENEMMKSFNKAESLRNFKAEFSLERYERLVKDYNSKNITLENNCVKLFLNKKEREKVGLLNYYDLFYQEKDINKKFITNRYITFKSSSKPKNTFADIFGLDVFIEYLKYRVELLDSKENEGTGSNNIPINIFYGPSGTGKSMLAAGLQHYTQKNVPNVTVFEYNFSEFKSARQINQKFEEFIKSSPCIVVIDEADFIISQNKEILNAIKVNTSGQDNLDTNVVLILITNEDMKFLNEAILTRVEVCQFIDLPNEISVYNEVITNILQTKGVNLKNDIVNKISKIAFRLKVNFRDLIDVTKNAVDRKAFENSTENDLEVILVNMISKLNSYKKNYTKVNIDKRWGKFDKKQISLNKNLLSVLDTENTVKIQPKASIIKDEKVQDQEYVLKWNFTQVPFFDGFKYRGRKIVVIKEVHFKELPASKYYNITIKIEKVVIKLDQVEIIDNESFNRNEMDTNDISFSPTLIKEIEENLSKNNVKSYKIYILESLIIEMYRNN